MNIDLTQQTALVTGASRGIGRAIAVALGKQGATVVGTATTDNGAAKIKAYLDEQGINGQGMLLDVASDESIKALADEFRTNSPVP